MHGKKRQHICGKKLYRGRWAKQEKAAAESLDVPLRILGKAASVVLSAIQRGGDLDDVPLKIPKAMGAEPSFDSEVDELEQKAWTRPVVLLADGGIGVGDGGPVHRLSRRDHAVVMVDDAGFVVATWSSQRRAAKALGVSDSAVSLCVRGHQPAADGYRLFRHRDGGCYPTCPSGPETRTTIPGYNEKKELFEEDKEICYHELANDTTNEPANEASCERLWCLTPGCVFSAGEPSELAAHASLCTGLASNSNPSDTAGLLDLLATATEFEQVLGVELASCFKAAPPLPRASLF